MIALSTEQAAGLAAFEELVRSFPFKRFSLSIYATGDGLVADRCYTHCDFDTANGKKMVSGGGATLVDAALGMFVDANQKLAEPEKPKPLDGAETKSAVTALIDGYRNSDDGKPFGPLLDELANRVAAIPVKD